MCFTYQTINDVFVFISVFMLQVIYGKLTITKRIYTISSPIFTRNKYAVTIFFTTHSTNKHLSVYDIYRQRLYMKSITGFLLNSIINTNNKWNTLLLKHINVAYRISTLRAIEILMNHFEDAHLWFDLLLF